MPPTRLEFLTPENGYIYRIIHIDNLSWHLANGIPCCNCNQANPDFVAIGSPEIITRRKSWKVDAAPYGTLADYVPFYFTPRSLMQSDILQGLTVAKQPKADILFFVSSLPRLQEQGLPFLFTNQHASSRGVRYYRDLGDLAKIDWKILQAIDFRRDPENDPDKTKRYQAEALIYQHLPTSGLLGLACCDDDVKSRVQRILAAASSPLRVAAKPEWYPKPNAPLHHR